MKIFYDHQVFSVQQYGGISRYYSELIKGFGCEAFLGAPLFVNEYLLSVPNLIGLNCAWLPRAKSISWAVNSFLSPYLIYYCKPDLVHETYYLGGDKKNKVVTTVHDMIHELYPDYFSSNDQTAKQKKLSVERADHVICVSENTRNDLIRILGVPPEKTSVVYLGVTIVEPAEIKEEKPFILYVGARGGYKNFLSLLSAYSKSEKIHKNYNLICFGGGEFSADEMCEINNYGLFSSVKQVSGIDSVLAGYYKRASLLVYPSIYEGFGIPPLEAMGYGCPVLCSNLSSIPEVVGDAARLFDPHSEGELYDGLVSLLNDDRERARLIRLGFERVREFTWEKCILETRKVYLSLL